MFLEFYAAMFVFLSEEDWAILIHKNLAKNILLSQSTVMVFVFMQIELWGKKCSAPPKKCYTLCDD